MKCGYSHCKHGGEVDKAAAVKEGTRYYHPDCLREKQAITEIIDVYHKRVDQHPIENFLRKVVNDLVLKDGYGAEFLLFALKYCLDHGWTLHSPNGLRYVARDGTAKKEWDRLLSWKMNSEMQKKRSEEMVDATDIKTEATFKFTPQKAKGFDDIFG